MSIHQYPGAGSGVVGLDVEPEDTFISVYEDVWQVLKGTSSLSAYMALKRHVHPRDTSWFSTRKALAAEAGMSVNTFDRAIQQLVSLGLVVVQYRYVPAGWKGDVSQIVFERSDEYPQQIGSLFHVRFHLPATPPTQKWGDPLPKNDGTPSPNLGTRHITHDIDPKRGGGVEAQVTGSDIADNPPPSPPALDAPSAATAVPPATAGATPDTWSTPEHPRCRAHAHIPPGEEVPPCRQCGSVREWFEEQDLARMGERHAAIQACPMCDDRGLIEASDATGRPIAVRCDHHAPPGRVDGPGEHVVVASAETRAEALRRFRRSA